MDHIIIAPESPSPDISPVKDEALEEKETSREGRRRRREDRKSLQSITKRSDYDNVYNLRSVDRYKDLDDVLDFLDENYSDMDSIFGENRETFYDISLSSMFGNSHDNLGIPADVMLECGRSHSLTQYLDLELPLVDRGDPNRTYIRSARLQRDRIWSSSDPELNGQETDSLRSRWIRTVQAFRSCMSGMKLFRRDRN